MKKILIIFLTGILLSSCGYKKLNYEEKFTLLYKAEILKQKDARVEINKIYSKISEAMKKDNSKAIKEAEEYNEITDFLQSSEYKYKRSAPGNMWLNQNDIKYPPLKEITGKKDEPVNALFCLYTENGDIYNYLTKKLFTGTAVFRYGNGEIDNVINIKDGKVINTVQENKYDTNGNLIQEAFYNENNILTGVKTYKAGVLKQELYILERYEDNKIKKDYIILNGEEKGKIREYDSKEKIIKETEK